MAPLDPMNIDIEKLDVLLTALGIVAPPRLGSRLELEDYADRPDHLLALAAGERQRLGELLRAACLINEVQLEDALAEQRRTGHRLGDVLIARGLITERERDIALEFQQRQSAKRPAAGKLCLGSILVATGQITHVQLEDALQRQAATGRRLGDELIAAGYIGKGQIEGGLSLQRTLVAAVLITALALANGPGTGDAWAAETGAGQRTVRLQVMARVAGFFRVQIQYQADSLTITSRDIERGFVEVPAASRFSVTTNSRVHYLIDIRPIGEIFQAVQINGLSGPVELDANGGTIIANAPRAQASATAHELGYRFMLRPGIQPGDYPWPLVLAVHPM